MSEIEQEKTTNRINMILFIFAGFMIILDQATKIAVKGFNLFGFRHDGMYYGETISIIGDFLQLTFIENPGMAFGLSFGAGKIFLSLFSVFASVFLAWYLYKLRRFSPFVQAGIALVLAGAMGNLVDRVFYGVFYGYQPLFYGYVVDFILVDIPDIDFLGLNYTHWPIFNIADSCVTCGVAALLIFNNKIPTFKQLLGKETAEKTDSELEPVSEN